MRNFFKKLLAFITFNKIKFSSGGTSPTNSNPSNPSTPQTAPASYPFKTCHTIKGDVDMVTAKQTCKITKCVVDESGIDLAWTFTATPWPDINLSLGMVCLAWKQADGTYRANYSEWMGYGTDGKGNYWYKYVSALAALTDPKWGLNTGIKIGDELLVFVVSHDLCETSNTCKTVSPVGV